MSSTKAVTKKTIKKAIIQSYMTPELLESIGEIKSDVRWLKQTMEKMDKRYAPFWIKYPVYGGTAGILSWAMYQVLQLIQVANAMFF